MVHTDRENQKPVDWADAMGQNILCPLSHDVRDLLGTLWRTDTHGRAARYVSGGPLISDCVVCVYGGVCASLYESVSLGELLLLVSTV